MAETISVNLGMSLHLRCRGDHWVLVGIFPHCHLPRCFLSYLVLSLLVQFVVAPSFIPFFKTPQIWQLSLNGTRHSIDASHVLGSRKLGEPLSHICLDSVHSHHDLVFCLPPRSLHRERGSGSSMWVLSSLQLCPGW